LNAGEEISGQYVVACGESSEVLEFVEEALDEIAFTVEDKIIGTRRLAGRAE
jgi:GDP-D-mannose dehydratase